MIYLPKLYPSILKTKLIFFFRRKILHQAILVTFATLDDLNATMTIAFNIFDRLHLPSVSSSSISLNESAIFKKKPLQNILQIPPVRKMGHEKQQGPLPSSEHRYLKKHTSGIKL